MTFSVLFQEFRVFENWRICINCIKSFPNVKCSTVRFFGLQGNVDREFIAVIEFVELLVFGFFKLLKAILQIGFNKLRFFVGI